MHQIRRLLLNTLGVLSALLVLPAVQGDSLFLLFKANPPLLYAGSFGKQEAPPPKQQRETNSYALKIADGFPAWFWNPPDQPTAVGYSPMYRESPTAYDSAFHNGAWRLYLDQRAIVSGGTATSETAYGTFHEGSSIDYQLSDGEYLGFEGFLKRVVRLDSCIVPALGVGKAMRIMLVGLQEMEVDGTILKPPADIDAPPGVTDAIGVSRPYFYASSTWDEAERLSRIQLAVTISQAQGLTTMETYDSRRTTQTNVTARTVNIVVNSVLSNVRVVKRRFDPASGAHKVWVVGKVTANR